MLYIFTRIASRNMRGVVMLALLSIAMINEYHFLLKEDIISTIHSSLHSHILEKLSICIFIIIMDAKT